MAARRVIISCCDHSRWSRIISSDYNWASFLTLKTEDDLIFERQISKLSVYDAWTQHNATLLGGWSWYGPGKDIKENWPTVILMPGISCRNILRSPAILFFPHGEKFGGKLFGNLWKITRRAACVDFTFAKRSPKLGAISEIVHTGPRAQKTQTKNMCRLLQAAHANQNQKPSASRTCTHCHYVM